MTAVDHTAGAASEEEIATVGFGRGQLGLLESLRERTVRRGAG